MEKIHPLTSLQKNSKAVREDAAIDIVRITENGNAAYIFCSESVFEDYIAREREDAAYEAHLVEATRQGLVDIEEGRYVTSIEEAFTQADLRRENHA